MIEIPSDLHPQLVPLAFLLGRWTGAGVHDFPGAEQCNFGQEVVFSHDGRPFLAYTSYTWVLDAEGNKVRPLENETGFWRIDAERKVDITLTRDEGVAEIWTGELAPDKPQIDLVTDAVARLAGAPDYSGGKRLYGYVNGDLMWVGEKSTPSVELRPYMSAHLKKVPDPREWIGDLKDLPDDGIAFFK
ncbi:FABP family protein [Actinacidiphila acididurans]|uniref:Ferric nitrobindin-like protein n=1 Tax=Actinacidiphila acididurans TaxID=2784346 RepID=A0ABS2U1R5_9ACTN|nr:FABP family protein [Actinacidiphila acididurans]MBM9508460.1 FABP family protein [Actinacidiphila acididurans]